MAFADFDWATDTNYPAGSETWSATPVKVAPSAGVQADGFAPTDQPPAQWLNWLFNEIVTAGQALELAGQALELRGLQAAWDQSEMNGDTTPHIDVGTEDLVIGGTANADLFKVQNSTQGATARNLAVTQDFTVSGESSLSYSGGIFLPGGTAAHRLLAKDASGQVVEYQGVSGAWTPSVASVYGTGVVSGDVSTTAGHYQRIGNVVMFTMRFVLDTTGWSGTVLVEFAPPAGAAVSGAARGTAVPEQPDATRFINTGFYTVSGLVVSLTVGASLGVSRAIQCSGSYLIA